MLITTTTAKSGKINIFADGEYQFTVPALLWFSSSFSQNSDITSEELEQLKTQSDFSAAFESAMRMLSLRAHSKKELVTKLCAKFPKESCIAAAEKCCSLGLIDDESYAAALARELSERKGYAPKRILQELYSRGVNRENSQNAISGLDNSSENSIIKTLQKLGITAESSQKDINRAVRRLVSMGYSFAEIKNYLKIDDTD